MSIKFNAFQLLTEGVLVVLVVFFSNPRELYAKSQKMKFWVTGGSVPLSEGVQGGIVVLLVVVLIFVVFGSVVPYVYERMVEIRNKRTRRA